MKYRDKTCITYILCEAFKSNQVIMGVHILLYEVTVCTNICQISSQCYIKEMLTLCISQNKLFGFWQQTRALVKKATNIDLSVPL